jgi:uncharacterized protein YkwD
MRFITIIITAILMHFGRPAVVFTSPSPAQTPTVTITLTATQTPAPSATQPSPTATAKPIIIDNLFNAMNTYRANNGLGQLSKDSELCRIAQTRANDQQSRGSLDHAGFQSQAQAQKAFKHIAEILQYWSIPRTATYLVETGWAGSGEHAAIMRDSKWTHGCGATVGFYSVFVFGSN